MFNSKKITALLVVLSLMMIFSGCGGSGSQGDMAGLTDKTSTTIIPESVSVVKSGDNVTVNYQTAAPVKSGSVVTSGLTFNNAPLWSNFHETTTSDGLNHTATIKAPAAKASFMIFNSPSDKYDNNGKGIEIK